RHTRSYGDWSSDVCSSDLAAQARGAEILGEVLGYGSTSDAHHLTAPDPTGRPAARAISLALRDAGATPADVAYVNAHGTSTLLKIGRASCRERVEAAAVAS